MVLDLHRRVRNPKTPYEEAKELVRSTLLIHRVWNADYSTICVSDKVGSDVIKEAESNTFQIREFSECNYANSIIPVIMRAAGLFVDKSICNPYLTSAVIPFQVYHKDEYETVECYLKSFSMLKSVQVIFKFGDPQSHIIRHL
ncbi:Unannotated [Lentimonas sp. CC19]|nr:Unannotated [Lentimonas sp. CC4]CAA6686927.1 Unannotated [Lentimonas sp. CC6]CAA6690110.1 Unannotated [Lentimonas sp. CC19]CAA6690928.1 Unannotated [Lentimonas sp. CC10]CAA7070720.1 Unannotated [Lentimonas sp. CC11]CAA7169247.1 Unannotated [Lentimonas sp. CC21]CAA7180355.1 Unannotated [Lentimonas sp. CC8]